MLVAVCTCTLNICESSIVSSCSHFSHLHFKIIGGCSCFRRLENPFPSFFCLFGNSGAQRIKPGVWSLEHIQTHLGATINHLQENVIFWIENPSELIWGRAVGGLIRNAIHLISSRSSVCRNHFVGVLVQRFCSLGSFAPEETEGFLSVQISSLPQEVEFQVYAAGLVVTADALREGTILCWITCIGLYSLNGSGRHTFTEHCPLACMMAMISLSTFMEHLWIFEPRASKWMRGFVIICNTIGHAPASLCIVFRVPRWKCYTRVALCLMIRLYKSVCLCISLRMPEHLCGRQEFSSLPSANTNSLENRYITWCARCWALIMSMVSQIFCFQFSRLTMERQSVPRGSGPSNLLRLVFWRSSQMLPHRRSKRLWRKTRHPINPKLFVACLLILDLVKEG